MIQKNSVEYFPALLRQSERYIRHAENRFGTRILFLDSLYAEYGLLSRTYIVLIPRSAREDQRVKNYFTIIKSELLREQIKSPFSYFKFSFDGYRHSLIGVFIYKTDNKNGAMFLGESGHFPYLFFSVLKIHRIYYRSSSDILQSSLYHLTVGTVYHDRRAGFSEQRFENTEKIIYFYPVGIRRAEVKDSRSASCLRSSYLGCFFKSIFSYQAFELP